MVRSKVILKSPFVMDGVGATLKQGNGYHPHKKLSSCRTRMLRLPAVIMEAVTATETAQAFARRECPRVDGANRRNRGPAPARESVRRSRGRGPPVAETSDFPSVR